jgi:hypothetical protein
MNIYQFINYSWRKDKGHRVKGYRVWFYISDKKIMFIYINFSLIFSA